MHLTADGNQVTFASTADSKGIICGECKVLLQDVPTRQGGSTSKYGSCNAYCSAVGRVCTGAWAANVQIGCGTSTSYTALPEAVTCETPFTDFTATDGNDPICDCGAPDAYQAAAAAQQDLQQYYADVLGGVTPTVDGVVLENGNYVRPTGQREGWYA